jgi:hypothetical protein
MLTNEVIDDDEALLTPINRLLTQVFLKTDALRFSNELLALN